MVGKGGAMNRDYRSHEPAHLPACGTARPPDREKTQSYIQRYIAHFPAAGLR